MKVAFLIGSPAISGGTNVIFHHVDFLLSQGWDLTCVTETPVEYGLMDWYPVAKKYCWKTYAELADVEFDIVISTFWATNFHLHRLRSRQFAYFIQSIESRFYPKDDPQSFWAEGSYLLPLHRITVAQWMQKYLREKFDAGAEVVLNGMDKEFFRPEGPVFAPRVSGQPRVLVEGTMNVFFKNVERTIELVRQAGAGEVWLLTGSDVKEYPGVDRVFSRVPFLKTPEIYRSCDVLVKLSRVEGMFGPPLEMFHCGGTAVVYDVTGYDEYIRHGENALVLKMEDEKGVVETLRALLRDPAELARLKQGALKTAAAWPDWRTSSERFLRILEEVGRAPVFMARGKLAAEIYGRSAPVMLGHRAPELRDLLKERIIRHPWIFRPVRLCYRILRSFR